MLRPAVRQAAKETLLVDNGFRCREQIAQTTGRSTSLGASPGHAGKQRPGGETVPLCSGGGKATGDARDGSKTTWLAACCSRSPGSGDVRTKRDGMKGEFNGF